MTVRYEWTPAIKHGQTLSAIGVSVHEADDRNRANLVRTAMIQVKLLREVNPSVEIVLVRRPVDVQWEEVIDSYAEDLIRPRADNQCRYSKDEQCGSSYAGNCLAKGQCWCGHGPIPVPAGPGVTGLTTGAG